MSAASPFRPASSTPAVALRRLSLPAAVTATAVLAVVLSGCGAGPAATPAPSPMAPSISPTTQAVSPAAPPASASPSRRTSSTPRAEKAEPAADVSIAVVVADGTVSPNAEDVKVKQGQTVRVTIRSDVAESIHVHGYDETAAADAGKPGEVTFTADVKGVFEVETHDSGKLVAKLIVS